MRILATCKEPESSMGPAGGADEHAYGRVGRFRRRLAQGVRSSLWIDRGQAHNKGTHLPYLLICTFLVFTPFLLQCEFSAHQSVTLFSFKLPTICMSQRLFGVACPGCGLTRSFVLLAHGHFRASWEIHHLGIPLYLFFGYQIVYRSYCLRHLDKPIPKRWLDLQNLLPSVLIILLLGNWIAGLWS